MRLIDCNETLRKVEQIPFVANENKAFHEGCRYMQKKVLRILHEAKSVDAEPVRHGEWVKYSVDIPEHPLHCSNCGWSNHHIQNKFIEELERCPNCGAKMDEVSE